jgi:hypothetical protein
MADILYSKAGDFTPLKEDDIRMRTAPLRPVVVNFVANIRRLHSVWMLLPHLVELSCLNVVRLTEAIFALTGKPFLTKEESKNSDLAKRVHERVWSDIEKRAKSQNISWIQASGYDFTRGLDRFDELLIAIPQLKDWSTPALAQQLLSAWTAFEVLSTDLWVAALNENPLRLVPAFTKRPDGDQEKSLSIFAIQQVGYDLRHSMGTLLRNTGKANFISLSSTRRVYEKTFGSELSAIFEDENLRLLELIRNLFAHRAGKVDETFVRETASLKYPFGTPRLGEMLELDGPIVRDLCLTAMKRGQELATFVDDWLQENPTTSPNNPALVSP